MRGYLRFLLPACVLCNISTAWTVGVSEPCDETNTCDKNLYCNSVTGTCKSCSIATGGTATTPGAYPYSDAEAKDIDDCYKTCPIEALIKPESSEVYYKTEMPDCIYTGCVKNAHDPTPDNGTLECVCNDYYKPNDANTACEAIRYEIKYELKFAASDRIETQNQNCNIADNPDCTIINPQPDVDFFPKDSCHVFKGWTCTVGCKEQTVIDPDSDSNFFDDVFKHIKPGTTSITLSATAPVCPNGYYCKSGTAEPCPYPGTTTSNSATECAHSAKDCFISNATQFRDKNNKIFTLPIDKINYK